MKVLKLPLEGCYMIEYDKHPDERGHLAELFNMETLPPELASIFPVQQNTLAVSRKGVLRGIHQSPFTKLMTCIRGAVYDVAVDLRPESCTYLQWVGVVLSEENSRQLVVPAHCGHAYYSMKDKSTILYCQDKCYGSTQHLERTISAFDPVLNVQWTAPLGSTPIMSPKDLNAGNLDLNIDLTTGGVPVQEKRQRILVIGASGQVGRAIVNEFEKYKSQYVVFGTYNSFQHSNFVHFDMERAASEPGYSDWLLQLCHPNVIIICAALTAVDVCEKEPERAKCINITSVKWICESAKRLSARQQVQVVFFSTDYVFEGKCEGVRLTEEDEVGPLNEYGRLKMEAELSVLGIMPDALVIRTSRVYGPELQGKNFVYQVIERLRAGQHVHCNADEISCPTYNKDIACAVRMLLRTQRTGIFHCAGPESMSKYAWACNIADMYALDTRLIEGVSASYNYVAQRPGFVALDTSKLRKAIPEFSFSTLDAAMLDWRDNAWAKPLAFTSSGN